MPCKKRFAFSNLIPEERIILGELEFTHVVFMDRLRTEHVQSREKPATARGTLVGDPFALYLIGEVSIQIVLALPINGSLLMSLLVIALRIALSAGVP